MFPSLVETRLGGSRPPPLRDTVIFLSESIETPLSWGGGVRESEPRFRIQGQRIKQAQGPRVCAQSQKPRPPQVYRLEEYHLTQEV